MGDVLPFCGILIFSVPAMTCSGGSCAALTTGSVSAWQVRVDPFPSRIRQKSESRRACLRTLTVRPTIAPATRTPWPTVAVPLFEPTSPSTARVPSRNVTSPSANTAYAKGEVGGPPRSAWLSAARATPTTITTAIVARHIDPPLHHLVTRHCSAAPGSGDTLAWNGKEGRGNDASPP